MVRRVSSLVRSWILVGALAQAALPGIVSVVHADAAASVVVAGIRPHAEDPSAPRHPPLHQEDSCALCQFFSGIFATAAGGARLPLLQTGSVEAVHGRELAPDWPTDGSPSLPRAPPTLA